MIEVRVIKAVETYQIRIEVLRNGVPENFHFQGDEAIDSFHLGAFQDNSCIGISTFIRNNHSLLSKEAAYQLRGMAILPKYQKQGVGKKILIESYKYLAEHTCQILWCNAREIAVNFYKKSGFAIIGEPFNIPKIGLHYIMYKRL